MRLASAKRKKQACADKGKRPAFLNFGNGCSRLALSRTETAGNSEMEDDPVVELLDAFGFTQSRVVANQFILVEVLRELAAKSDDPDAYLNGLVERIDSRLDQIPADHESKAQAIRKAVMVMFARARSESGG